MGETTAQGNGLPGRIRGRDMDSGDEISLRPYFETLWSRRRFVGVTVVGVAAVFVAAVLALWLFLPAERIATIEFRVNFDGAADNRYPNGMPFSPPEIVAAPVLAEVWQRNDLGRFGTLSDFKGALFILESNPELELLAYEYDAKLADSKLLPADRAAIEQEFRQKRAALRDPVYSINLRSSERFTRLPAELGQKVLTDTLNTWAEQAELRKGALNYQVPMLSSAILSKDAIEQEDFFVGADLLRAKAQRVVYSIAQIEAIPGAMTIRTTKDNASLAEIRASIEDVLRFDLEPLLGIIRAQGITRDRRLLQLYASNRLFQTRLERQEAEARASAIEDSLREYTSQRLGRQGSDARSGSVPGAGRPSGAADTPALIPQLGDSFLDRLIELSSATQQTDTRYRQDLVNRLITEKTRVAAADKEMAFYEDLVRSLQSPVIGGALSAELSRLVGARTTTAYQSIARSTDQLAALYKELSVQNLIPSARLYSTTVPFVQRKRSTLSLKWVAVAFVLVMFVTVVVVPVRCLVREATRKKTGPTAG